MLSLRSRMLFLACLLLTALAGCSGDNHSPVSPQIERDTGGGGGGGGGGGSGGGGGGGSGM